MRAEVKHRILIKQSHIVSLWAVTLFQLSVHREENNSEIIGSSQGQKMFTVSAFEYAHQVNVNEINIVTM